MENKEKFEIYEPTPVCMECKNCSLCVYVANNLYSVRCKKKMCDSVIADKPMACSKFQWIHSVNKKRVEKQLDRFDKMKKQITKRR